MGQQKGNPTPSYQNQAYETLRPNTNARENRDYGTKPVMIDDTKTLDELIDSGSQGFTQGYAKDTDLTSQLMCADIEIASGNNQAAFDRLLSAIKRFSGDEKDKAKAHLIQLFNLVDPSDPRLVKARSELASLLF